MCPQDIIIGNLTTFLLSINFGNSLPSSNIDVFSALTYDSAVFFIGVLDYNFFNCIVLSSNAYMTAMIISTAFTNHARMQSKVYKLA